MKACWVYYVGVGVPFDFNGPRQDEKNLGLPFNASVWLAPTWAPPTPEPEE